MQDVDPWTQPKRPLPTLESTLRYHSVPKGWSAGEIITEHARLGGTYSISGPEATEPGAPSWMIERSAWLQYRETLHRIAQGVGAKDPACVEIAVRYIEQRYIGSYSGYIRTLLCRHLKHARLSPDQSARLHWHFCNLLSNGVNVFEYQDYLKLWRSFITVPQATELINSVRENPQVLVFTNAIERLTAALIPDGATTHS